MKINNLFICIILVLLILWWYLIPNSICPETCKIQ